MLYSLKYRMLILITSLGFSVPVVYSEDSANCFMQPVWSPVHDDLIFSSCAGDESDIWKLDLDTGKIDNLTLDIEGDSLSPIWSPNGNQVAFINVVDASSSIWLMNADGSSAYNLSDKFRELDNTEEYGLSWSPDSSNLAFVAAENYGGYSNIYQVSVNELGLREVTSPKRKGNYDYLNWSPDSSIIIAVYLDSMTNIIDIIAFELNTSNQYPLYRLEDIDQFVSNLEWGNNLQQIIFIQQGFTTGQNEIISIDFTTQKITPLTLAIPGSKNNPIFSPDSQYIAFEISDITGNHLWIMNADGSNAHHITENMDHNLYFSPSWSPDGNRIAFDSPNGDIWIISVNGANAVNVTNNN